MAVAVSNPTNQRIEVRTKLSPKGWREAGEDGIKGGSEERERERMGLFLITREVRESWGPGAATVPCRGRVRKTEKYGKKGGVIKCRQWLLTPSDNHFIDSTWLIHFYNNW